MVYIFTSKHLNIPAKCSNIFRLLLTLMPLLFHFQNNNHKFYQNFILPVCQERPLPFYYFCETGFQPDVGWNTAETYNIIE
jgi:hypothetical protein